MVWLIASLAGGLLVWQIYRLLQACRRANRVDWGRDLMNLVDGLNRLFCYRYHRLNVVGLRLPKSGPAIVVANHISGLDPLLLIASSRRPLRFLVAREQYQRFGMTWLLRAMGCIPVDRERRPERALRSALRALQEGEVIALFPHGKIHLDSEPPRQLKAGAARLAQLAGTCILPLRITGVAGAGHVVRGVVVRSRARVEAFPAIDAVGWEFQELLSELKQILDGHR